jgi:hypothetical protein
MNYNSIPKCPTCGQHFDNIFDATDHLLEEGETEFDPKLILPNGYSLMVGSLLRSLFFQADDAERIREITQGTYATLYTAENNPSEMRTMIENIVIDENIKDIDKEYEQLIKDNNA